ncbi:uncharacterized protein N7482_007871 [Penicillium canariense]|uniref:Uncharacterized protein n=1 Tax=Penicillium canariense TaxID=189055 RepID=A0A9W9HXL3_9EURO|nr:uncharacterized protein N7482_007871 [Penicillium canariense]KAJ5160867.1 hypothetical protein N7482_007871 [Penicillium canariense]
MPAGKAPPQAAFVEDFDEDAHDIVPDSRQSANTTANTAVKLSSRLDLRFPAEPLIDGASDSGYSSRTAATVNSTQSGPSGGKSPPVPLKLDMPKQRTGLARKSSGRKERKDKERVRPEHAEKMPMGAYPGSAHHHAHVQRSPSKSRRRDSAHIRHYPPEAYYEGSAYYHQPSTPVERPPMDYPPYHFTRPPMPDYPRRRHRHLVILMLLRNTTVHLAGPAARARTARHYYEHGPPSAAVAYAPQQYASSPYGGSFHGGSEYGPPSDYPRERSRSRTREPSQQPQTRARRSSSIYGPPPMEQTVFPDWVDEAESLDHWPSQEVPREVPREYRREREAPREYHREVHHEATRGRAPKPPRDEDYYRMPPPPPPAPQKHKAQVHQIKRPEPRKAQTTQAVPRQRRQSRTAMDMSDMAAALPDYGRRVSREARMPERSHSLRDSKRSNSYHDSARGAQIAVENSRRRRTQQYYYDDGGSTDTGGLEDREREVEHYQAQQSGRMSTLPASAEALLTKSATVAGSDNGSAKSRSNSSRGSGSGESKNMNLTVNGLTIGFTEESVAGKNISIRAGDTGRVQLSIAGERRPKQYLTGGSSYSDNTGRASRRELEEAPRRPRDDRRSERASRRSSQSSYGGPRRYAM